MKMRNDEFLVFLNDGETFDIAGDDSAVVCGDKVLKLNEANLLRIMQALPELFESGEAARYLEVLAGY